MTLFKSMWRAAGLMGIAGVLLFAGLVGAQTISVTPNTAVTVEVGATSGRTLTASALSFTSGFTYQWYSITQATAPTLTSPTEDSDVTTGGYTAVAGASSVTYDVPTTTAKATTWYVVVAKYQTAEWAVSNAVSVTVKEPTVDTKTITFAKPANGTLTADLTLKGDAQVGVKPGNRKVDEGSNVEFTATPNAGYQVAKWTSGGEEIDGETGETYTLENVEDDATIGVEFEQINPTVVITLDDNGTDLSELMVGVPIDNGKRPVFTFTLDEYGDGSSGEIGFGSTMASKSQDLFKFAAFAEAGLTQTIARTSATVVTNTISGTPKTAVSEVNLEIKELSPITGSTAAIPNLKVTVVPAFDDEETVSVTVAKADLTDADVLAAVVDLSKAETYFAKTVANTVKIDALYGEGSNGVALKGFASGDKVVLKAGYKNPGSNGFAFVYSNDEITEGEWITNPRAVGTYDVGVVLDGEGANIEIPEDGDPIPLTAKLQVRAATLASDADFTTVAKEWTVPFSAEGVYTLPAYVLKSSEAGTLDSVRYTVKRISNNSGVWQGTYGSGDYSNYELEYSEDGNVTLKVPSSVAKGFKIAFGVTGYGVTGTKGSANNKSGAAAGLGYYFENTIGATEASARVLSVTGKSLKDESVVVVLSEDEEDFVYKGTKNPIRNFTVFDGEEELTTDDHYTIQATSKKNQINAGPAVLVLKGKGNYSDRDSIEIEYDIVKAPIEATLAVAGKRTYDGTTKVDTVGAFRLTVGFTGYVNSQGTAAATKVKNVKSYAVSELAFDSPDAGDERVVSGKLTINPLDSILRNYRFEDSADEGELSFEIEDVKIWAREPAKYSASNLKQGDTTTFAFSIPGVSLVEGAAIPKHYYNGKTQGIGEVTFKSPIANPGAEVITVGYKYPSGSFLFDGDDSVKVSSAKVYTTPPRRAAKYEVYAKVEDGGENIVAGTGDGVQLGVYEIYAPAAPTFTALPATVEVKEGYTKNITVVASSPNGGDVSYQWYQFANSVTASGAKWDSTTAIIGATSATYTVVANDKTAWKYGVELTNSFADDAVQFPASVRTGLVAVTVSDAPKDITGKAVLEFNDTAKASTGWTYTGKAIEFVKGGSTPLGVKVFLTDSTGAKTATALDGKYYTLEYENNTDAGTATVTAVGDITFPGNISYVGEVSRTFTIVPKALVKADLTLTASREYNYGDTLNATVALAAAAGTGIGAISVKYNDSTAVPRNVGRYEVTVDVAAGTNYLAAADLNLGYFNVTKKTPVVASLVFDSIPKNHVAGDSTTAYGIGAVTLRGSGKDSVSVRYNGSDKVPTAAGNYAVTAVVFGKENYNSATVSLGTYTIKVKVAVAEVAREIPKPAVTEVVTVAPVKVVASGFTAGPSPVSQNGKIKFFSGKQVKSGSLYIFDAQGNAVAKVAAKPGTGEIGSWNLKSKNGTTVSEGTYVVKGALVGKDGTREKVSFVFAVVK